MSSQPVRAHAGHIVGMFRVLHEGDIHDGEITASLAQSWNIPISSCIGTSSQHSLSGFGKHSTPREGCMLLRAGSRGSLQACQAYALDAYEDVVASGQAHSSKRCTLSYKRATRSDDQMACLKSALHHPPAHEALCPPHKKEEAQALSKRLVYLTTCSKIQGWPSKSQAQHAAPRTVCIFHPVYEFEVFQRHIPAVCCQADWLQEAIVSFRRVACNAGLRVMTYLFTRLNSGDSWYLLNSSFHWICKPCGECARNDLWISFNQDTVRACS